MIRLAVAEDEPLFAKQLKEYLARYEEESGNTFSVSAFSDAADLLESYRAQYDLILMDIEMPKVSGMDAAKAIRKKDEETVIVFITNSPQYAIEGYAVGALDYLLKPLSYYAFTQCMERALRRVKKPDKTYLLVSNPSGSKKIDADDLKYVAVHGHTLVYHTTCGDLSAPGAMRDVEETLKDMPFFRCNKGDFVNLAYVDGIKDGDAIVGKEIVPVSRAKKKPFLDALNRYINEVRA